MHSETHNSSQKPQNHSKLEERVTFFFVAVGIITLTYGLLYVVDFLPEKPSTQKQEEVVVREIAPSVDVENVDALPVAVIFDSLERKVVVLNPESSTVEALDAALLNGVVRHPDSADFKKKGTIFLLGHSSYLPNVRNKNFQAFNGIQKLKFGDTIRLQSKDTEYVYRVDRAYEAKATTAEVPIQFGEAKLVLATCDSFGAKDDRFIVEATLVDTQPIVLDATPEQLREQGK